MNDSDIKIGLITFHDAVSYGAHLQCYGLEKFLLNNGFDTEIIDYSINAYTELRKKDCFFISRKLLKGLKSPIQYSHLLLNNMKKKIRQKHAVSHIRIRDKRFHDFRCRYYKLSKKRYYNYSDLADHCPKYDVFICGSDQIWHPLFCDRDPNYYLSFAPLTRRIAYAPSFGVKELPKGVIKEYRQRLSKIPYLSVREDSGVQIMKQLVNQDVQAVIDPTFLIQAEEWSSIADQASCLSFDTTQKNYILAYFIGDDSYIQAHMTQLTKIFKGYKIINLIFDYIEYGPCEFLKLIRDAKFVYTNSFHGLAFCIIFNKSFAVGKSLKDFLEGSSFDRIQFLLDKLNLSKRIVTDNNKCTLKWLETDFTETKTRLLLWKEESKQFLLNAVSCAATS